MYEFIARTTPLIILFAITPRHMYVRTFIPMFQPMFEKKNNEVWEIT